MFAVNLQEQGREFKRFSAVLAESGAQSAQLDGSNAQMQDAGSHDSAPLQKQNSSLSWSARQHLRRTSAASRHASASRHVPHQDNRLPPGEVMQSYWASCTPDCMLCLLCLLLRHEACFCLPWASSTTIASCQMDFIQAPEAPCMQMDSQ